MKRTDSESKQKEKEEYFEIESLIQKSHTENCLQFKTPCKELITFDESVDRAGGLGFFHVYAVTFFTFAIVTNGYLFYALPFLELYPEYICPPEIPNCTYKDRCQQPDLVQIKWDSDRTLINWVERLGLQCADSYLIGMIGSAYVLGWMIASLFVPRLGDIYGRKIPFLTSVVIAGCFQSLVLIVRDLNLIIGIFFMLGVCQAGKFSMAHVYLQELMPVKYRTTEGTIAQFADSFTLVFESLYFNYITKDWFPFQFFAVVMIFVSAIALYFVPESPKFLYSIGRFQDSRTALSTISRINSICTGVYAFNPNFKFDSELQQASQQLKIKQKPSGSMKELFDNKIYRVNFLIFVVQWITGTFTYYTIYFQLKYFKGDIFTNVIFAGISDMIAQMITCILFDRIGLKKTYLFSYFISVTCTGLYIKFGYEYEGLIPFLLLGSFYGFSSVLLINWLATPHLFPVIYSSSTQGLCNVFSRFATILAPQIAEIPQPMPMVIVTILCYYQIKINQQLRRTDDLTELSKKER